MHLRNITGHGGIYGAEQCILSWIDEMRRQGEVEFVVGCFTGTRQKEGAFIESLRRREVPVEIIAMRHHHAFGVTRHLVSLIRKYRADILHTHENRSDILGLPAARSAGIPAVATIHGFTNESWKTGFYNLVNLLFLRFAPFSRLICVSEAMRWRLVRRWGFSPRMVTVHNGIGRPRSMRDERNGDLRRELGLGSRHRMVGVIGRLSREKGQRFLLEAVPQVREDHPEAVFLLIGSGPDRERLENRTRELNLADCVRFLGYRKDVISILRSLDLLAVPSLSEGISMVLLEAMARGLPVVASRVGGIPEVMVHGQTGIMVPPGDPRCLARAVCSLLEQPELARQMGELAERRVREDFPLTRTTRILREIYEEVAGRAIPIPASV